MAIQNVLPGRLCQYGPLDGRALQRLAYGLAHALAALHAAGVSQLGLWPGTVMMDGEDPVLADPGAACRVPHAAPAHLGRPVRFPGYVPPEMIDGEPGGTFSDVHCWGAVVAFAARGTSPYGIGPRETVFCRILRREPDLGAVP